MSTGTAYWAGPGGQDTAERQCWDPKELDRQWQDIYGMPRSTLNKVMLRHVPKDAEILEVGCNAGNQMRMLDHQGWFRVHGIDICPEAVEKARGFGLEVEVGDACNLPFPGWSYDVVMVSGVLSHIPEPELEKALSEIRRVARTGIYGFEYWCPAGERPACPSRLWPDDYATRLCSTGDWALVSGVHMMAGSRELMAFLLERA